MLGAVALLAGFAAPLPPSVLSVCQAIADSDTLRGRVVAVRGRIVMGFETFALESSACKVDNRAGAFIWLDVPGAPEEPYSEGVTMPQFVEAMANKSVRQLASSVQWITPTPVIFHDDSNWRRLSKLLTRTKGPGDVNEAVATIIGRLDYSPSARFVCRPDGACGLVANFGHLNGYSRRIVISRVKDVRPCQAK